MEGRDFDLPPDDQIPHRIRSRRNMWKSSGYTRVLHSNMEMDDHLQKMNIKKQWIVAELIERLEEVLLDDSKPNRTTKIGTLASLMVHQAITTFLKDKQDVFAWSHEDMPGIDPLVMVHRLNVSPSFPPIRQKKLVFAQE